MLCSDFALSVNKVDVEMKKYFELPSSRMLDHVWLSESKDTKWN